MIDYAVSFELFIEHTCYHALECKHGPDVADYLLKKVNRIEDRCKELLELSCGFRLSDSSEVYAAWDADVRKPRNAITHSGLPMVACTDVEKAHSAVYQAIRWCEHQLEATSS